MTGMSASDSSSKITARIAPLPNLPLFHKLADRKVVVVGTSEAANWKAELLAAAGASVTRLDEWTAQDLSGVAIAIADLANAAEAARFAEAARAEGAIVNVIDKPEFSDVQFGTIVNRAPLVIGISTDGAAPMLGQSIRMRIEGALPMGLSAWAKAAKAWRPKLKQRVTDFSDRRRFWERFVAAAWREAERAPTDADFEQLLLDGPAGGSGRVIFITVDPKDPELLTLKALRALQSATVILHDDGIGPEVLELARREATRIPAGEGSARTLAGAGEIVVRLTVGEAVEEIAACRRASTRLVVIPGVSAA